VKRRGSLGEKPGSGKRRRGKNPNLPLEKEGPRVVMWAKKKERWGRVSFKGLQAGWIRGQQTFSVAKNGFKGRGRGGEKLGLCLSGQIGSDRGKKKRKGNKSVLSTLGAPAILKRRNA